MSNYIKTMMKLEGNIEDIEGLYNCNQLSLNDNNHMLDAIERAKYKLNKLSFIVNVFYGYESVISSKSRTLYETQYLVGVICGLIVSHFDLENKVTITLDDLEYYKSDLFRAISVGKDISVKIVLADIYKSLTYRNKLKIQN